MKVILKENVEGLSGQLGRGFGYNIQQRKNGFFAKRNPRGIVPPDGHLRFIIACASIARRKTYFTDISVPRTELHDALSEAHKDNVIPFLKKDIYHADDIINLQITFGL